MTSFVIWLITMVLILETKILDSAFNHFTEIRKITFFFARKCGILYCEIVYLNY